MARVPGSASLDGSWHISGGQLKLLDSLDSIITCCGAGSANKWKSLVLDSLADRSSHIVDEGFSSTSILAQGKFRILGKKISLLGVGVKPFRDDDLINSQFE